MINMGYFLAAALLAIGAASVVAYRHGVNVQKQTAAVEMAKHLTADSVAALEATRTTLQLEWQIADAQNKAAAAYEEGKRNAEAKAERLAAELRAGTVRLQNRWSGCETQRLSETAAAARELDAATRDREESATRIVRAAAECDAHVRGLQELIRSQSQASDDSSRR